MNASGRIDCRWMTPDGLTGEPPGARVAQEGGRGSAPRWEPVRAHPAAATVLTRRPIGAAVYSGHRADHATPGSRMNPWVLVTVAGSIRPRLSAVTSAAAPGGTGRRVSGCRLSTPADGFCMDDGAIGQGMGRTPRACPSSLPRSGGLRVSLGVTFNSLCMSTVRRHAVPARRARWQLQDRGLVRGSFQVAASAATRPGRPGRCRRTQPKADTGQHATSLCPSPPERERQPDCRPLNPPIRYPGSILAIIWLIINRLMSESSDSHFSVDRTWGRGRRRCRTLWGLSTEAGESQSIVISILRVTLILFTSVQRNRKLCFDQQLSSCVVRA